MPKVSTVAYFYSVSWPFTNPTKEAVSRLNHLQKMSSKSLQSLFLIEVEAVYYWSVYQSIQPFGQLSDSFPWQYSIMGFKHCIFFSYSNFYPPGLWICSIGIIKSLKVLLKKFHQSIKGKIWLESNILNFIVSIS